jgi:hypothetical protein
MDFAILNEHLERAGAQTYMANLSRDKFTYVGRNILVRLLSWPWYPEESGKRETSTTRAHGWL